MIAALCGGIAVLAVAAAIRPRPVVRSIVPPANASPRSFRLPRWWRLRRRTAAVDPAEVAVWCEGLARVVRSGSTLVTAVRTVDPPASCRSDVERIVLALDRGTRSTDALTIATDSPHLGLAVTVLRACAINGGPPAEPLDRAAATLRGRAADAAERRTQSAQARLSAVVMTVLPVAMLALLLATSPSTRAAAVSGAGLTAIVVGGALNIAGWRWMRHIVGRVAS